MWIKIIAIPADEKVVYIPAGLAKSMISDMIISFGKMNMRASVKVDNELEDEGGKEFNNPLQIKLTSGLISELRIYPSLHYQMKIKNRTIVLGPTIGLLLGPHDYVYTPNHMNKYSDRFGIYDRVGGLIYAFSPKTIDWDNNEVYGLYYDYTNEKWRFGVFPIPTVIYRRDFHSDPKDIKRLINLTNGKMFNSWRFGKLYLYKHVRKHSKLSKHVPMTEMCKNYKQVQKFIDDQKDVILKPIYLSRGRGICIINKVEDGYKVFDYRDGNIVEFKLENNDALENFFNNNEDLFNKYLIQKQLALAKIEGAPYDIRIVMQKDSTANWKCSGIECRVAAQKSLITNISRGGYALTLDEALKRSFPSDEFDLERIKKKILSLSQSLCESLSSIGHHFAEFGVDIAVDESGDCWIIEVNVFPSFKGFKVMDYDTYLAIRYTPILYASHLAGF